MAKGLNKKKEVKKPKKSIKEKRAAKREKKKKWFRGNEVARAKQHATCVTLRTLK